MRRREFVMGAAAAARALGRDGPPNIILAVAPVWRVDIASPPNVARLERAGVVVDRCYAANPSSAASKASLLTGMWLASGAAPIDKILAGRGLAAASFADAAALLDFMRANAARPYFACWMPPDSGIEANAATPPVTLPENVPADHVERAERRMAAHVMSRIAFDRSLGRILDAALVPGTIVAFTALHGDLLGSQGLDGAEQPFEESARVPFVIAHGGVLPAGQRREALASNADLMPTLLGLAELEIPSELQGRDFGAVLKGEAEAQESVYSHGRLGEPDEWRMIVRGAEKLVINARGEAVHHFNLAQDPREQLNRVEEPALKRNRDELRARLRQWAARLGDRPGGSRLRPR